MESQGTSLSLGMAVLIAVGLWSCQPYQGQTSLQTHDMRKPSQSKLALNLSALKMVEGTWTSGCDQVQGSSTFDMTEMQFGPGTRLLITIKKFQDSSCNSAALINTVTKRGRFLISEKADDLGRRQLDMELEAAKRTRTMSYAFIEILGEEIRLTRGYKSEADRSRGEHYKTLRRRASDDFNARTFDDGKNKILGQLLTAVVNRLSIKIEAKIIASKNKAIFINGQQVDRDIRDGEKACVISFDAKKPAAEQVLDPGPVILSMLDRQTLTLQDGYGNIYQLECRQQAPARSRSNRVLFVSEVQDAFGVNVKIEAK